MHKIIYRIPRLLLIIFFLYTVNVNASCKAMFRIERVSGNSFKVLDSSICNKSTTSYFMRINDGTKSYLYINYFNGSPYTITWSKDVTLTISLKIIDSTGSGCTDSTAQSFVIKSNTCNPNFSIYFPNSPSKNAQLYYANTNYSANTRFILDYGDGNQSFSFNPTHTYGNCGKYNLKLIVKDSVVNCKDSMQLELNLGLNANWSYSQMSGISYQFYNSSNYSGRNLGMPDSLYISYHWDFGDGDTSNFETIQHAYSSAGQYKVRLIVNYTHPNNSCNKHDTLEKLLVVGCKGMAQFTYINKSTRTYAFTSGSPSNLLHKWTFGDGNTSTSTAPTHTYANVQKSYDVSLIVNDTVKGCADTLTTTLYHQCNIDAKLNLYYDSTKPYQATLTNNSTGYISNHFWDFGDGTTSNAAAPNHTYTKTGAITLIYKAIDSIANCQRADTLTFWIDSVGGIKRVSFVLTIVDKTETSSSNIKKQLINSALNIFPNPFSNQITITSNDGSIDEVKLYGITGSEINLLILGDSNDKILQMPEGLPVGIYILLVNSSTGVSHFKLMRE